MNSIDDAFIAFAVFNMASSTMQASFEGKSVWKAGALSLLSSAASYGIGEAFKGVAMTFGNELLRAGAHGLASGLVSALDGGNFVSSFVSGAAASGMGSYAQGVNMDPTLMVASTTVMGGMVAWATGGDFLQGAMQGMTIGLLNHAMHDGGGGMGGCERCERLPDGTYVAPHELEEVRVLHIVSHPRIIEKPLKPVYPEFFVLMGMPLLRLGLWGINEGYQFYVRNQIWKNRIIEFGNEPNSQYHAFRHIDEMGIDRGLVQDKVLKDLRTLDDIPNLTPVNRTINVSGRRIQYTVYKRYQNGRNIYNIGRVHEK